MHHSKDNIQKEYPVFIFFLFTLHPQKPLRMNRGPKGRTHLSQCQNPDGTADRLFWFLRNVTLTLSHS